MTLEESIQGFRLRVLREAERSGNVSATCRRFEVSRTLFYRWRVRLEQYGRDGLIPKRCGPPSGLSAAGQCAGRAAGDRGGVGVADLRAAVRE